MRAHGLALLFVVACAPSTTTDDFDPATGGKGDGTSEGGITRNWRVAGGRWMGWGSDRKTVVAVYGGQEFVLDVQSGRVVNVAAIGDARCDLAAPAGYSVRCYTDGIEIRDSADPNGVHVALHEVDDAFVSGDLIAAVYGKGNTNTSSISIVDRVTRTRLQTIDLQGTIERVEFLPGNRILVTIFGSTSYVYRISDGVLLATLKSASASPDRTVLAALDGLHDITTLAPTTALAAVPAGSFLAVSWAADSQSFAISSTSPVTPDQDDAYVYTRAGAYVRREHRPGGFQIEGTALDGSTLTTAGWLSPLRELSGTGDLVTAGAHAIVVSESFAGPGTLRIYDPDGRIRGSYHPFTYGESLRIALDKAGTRLAVLRKVTPSQTVSPTFSAELFDITNGTLTNHATISLGQDSQSDLAWSPDGTKLAVAGYQTARIYDRAGTFQRELATPWYTLALAWRPDGNAIAVSVMSKHVLGYDVIHGGQLFDLTVDRPLTSLAFSPDGEWLAGPTAYTPLRVLRTDGTEDIEVPNTVAATWSPSGDQLAILSDHGDLSLWDLATRTTTASRPLATEPCTAVTWPEESSILTTCGGFASFRADP